MTDTLLRELSNTDLDWMITRGSREKFPAGHVLLSPRVPSNDLFLVIAGRLSQSFASADAVNVVPEGVLSDELAQGEVIGFGPLFDIADSTVVQTLEESLILSLPIVKVKEKLAGDIAFAAHLYRAIAVMLSRRLRCIFEHSNRLQYWGRSAKEVLSVFGELRDSDVDWLVSFGQTETIAADRVLLQAGRPVDAFYILLDGQMAISAPEGDFNPLYLCFSGLENSTRDQKVFARLSKGGMPGITSFLDFHPLPVTLRAVEDSLVFAVPRQTLATKLQVDDSFSSRFYRVIAIQILELLQALNAREVDASSADASSADASSADDEELDMDDLQQLSEGAKKFNWMLSQLESSHNV
ncbi:MAG: cyclic nucleotide-binding domain-containing protein [Leptolyngbyaceae cyanobacterium SL_1_1]|nr:cyclic nucleotide-binding domain-containing protein [Leptolyngbyaceae cyanobacterium RM1_1_2]NJO11259.1 cyclic nucleotide-binding domain-containing protein [Leptolyngbyaceae cyanobacterium SL_1_1]